MKIIIIGDSLPIYEKCNLSSKIILTLHKKDEVEIEDNAGAWLYINNDKVKGWIYPFSEKGLLIESKDLSDRKYVIGNKCVIIPNTDSGEEYKISDKEIINVYDSYGKKKEFIIKEILTDFLVVAYNAKDYTIPKDDVSVVKTDNVLYDFTYFINKINGKNAYSYPYVGVDRKVDSGIIERHTYYKVDGKWYTSTPTSKPEPIEWSDINEDDKKAIVEKLGSDESTQDNSSNGKNGGDGSKSKDAAVKEEDPGPQLGEVTELTDAKIEELKSYILTFYSKEKTMSDNVSEITKKSLHNLRGVFGMPYQYLPIADLRVANNGSSNVINNSDIGIKYREKILSRMPLCIIMPGLVDFMPQYSNKERDNMIKEYMHKDDAFVTNIRKYTSSVRGDYYRFYPAWNLYYKYVNAILRMCSIFMDIGDKKFEYNGNTTILKEMDWKQLSPHNIASSSFFEGSLLYYLNTENQISESFSNNTTQSQLAAKTNAISDASRELMFMANNTVNILEDVGGTVGKYGAKTADTLARGILKGYNALRGSQSYDSNGVIGAIANGISNTITGSKMVFPELWQDSQFTRDYNITFKLDSPDNDPFSIFLNIIVPLVHTICLAAPKYTGPNTYAAPFLIRAFYQGFFNINLGIVTELSINKGNEGSWTYDNIPTEVEVHMNIKDLFNVNCMSMGGDSKLNTELNLLSNQPFVDYISNMCGLNIDEPDFRRLARMIAIVADPKFIARDTIRSVLNAFNQSFNQSQSNLYNSAVSLNFSSLKFGDLANVATGYVTKATREYLNNKINN